MKTKPTSVACHVLMVAAAYSASHAQSADGFPAPAAPAAGPMPVFDSAPSPFIDTAPPSFYAAPPSPYTPALPGMGSPLDPLRGFADRLLSNPLQWGPFKVLPFVQYSFSYSDGLLSSPGVPSETILHSITPGLRLQGRHLYLSYTPSLNYYTKGPYNDSLNHNASVGLNFGYGDWAFTLGHSYSRGDQVLVETAQQSETESHGTSLSATYRVSDRTSLQLTASQSLNESGDGFNDSKTWSTMNWLNYAWTEKTQVGVGVGGGFSKVEQGSDMTYQEVQGRINWLPRPKISLAVNGGFEIRQFIADEGADDRVNPVFGATGTYSPFEAPAFSLSANRGVAASLFADSITETTSVNLSVSQRLLGRLQAGLSVGMSFVEYQSTSSNFDTDRSEDRTFASASLGTSFLRKGSISAAYSYSQNESNQDQFTYDSNTISVQVGYHF